MSRRIRQGSQSQLDEAALNMAPSIASGPGACWSWGLGVGGGSGVSGWAMQDLLVVLDVGVDLGLDPAQTIPHQGLAEEDRGDYSEG